MSRRRKRSGYVTHKRAWHSNARAPRGKPWTRVEVILGELKAEKGWKAPCLPIFRTIIELVRKEYYGSKLDMDSIRAKGNAIYQFLWEHYQGNTRYQPSLIGKGLDEGDLRAAIDGVAFANWLDSYYAKHGSSSKRYGGSSEIVISEVEIKGAPHKHKAPKRTKIVSRVETEKERWARIAKERRDEEQEAYAASADRREDIARERDIKNIWLLISRGEFPLGKAAFEAELEKRAKERAADVGR